MAGFRFLLGIGFGPKSATIPIYASECAPANVRGALVMFWQFFTAFGIMLGYICGAIFRGVLDGTNGALCRQPDIPPPTVPTPRPSDVQQKLLSIRCVSNNLATAYHTSDPVEEFILKYMLSLPNIFYYKLVRNRRADLTMHHRA